VALRTLVCEAAEGHPARTQCGARKSNGKFARRCASGRGRLACSRHSRLEARSFFPGYWRILGVICEMCADRLGPFRDCHARLADRCAVKRAPTGVIAGQAARELYQHRQPTLETHPAMMTAPRWTNWRLVEHVVRCWSNGTIARSWRRRRLPAPVDEECLFGATEPQLLTPASTSPASPSLIPSSVTRVARSLHRPASPRFLGPVPRTVVQPQKSPRPAMPP